ncbi:Uncharacterised protein [uncultured archaeon]|nr:Uncharacterised protein [uncultured archaeon]
MRKFLLAEFETIIIILLLSGPGLAADASLKDDAYHYMKNGIDDQIYNEWWSFCGSDNGSQFMFVYLLSDPENHTSARKIQVQAIVLQDGQEPLLLCQNSRGYGGDYGSPTFDIDKSGFSYQEEQGFRVWGSAKEAAAKAVHWDLIYQPASSPWLATPVATHVGHLKGDWMKWLVYMPSARVTGMITIGNRTVSVNGIGYHDHVWGRWAMNDPLFAWAQVSVPKDGFSLTLGEARGEERNILLGLRYGDKTISFASKQIKLNYSAFAFDPKTATIFPTGYKVAARNGDYHLEMTVNVQKNVPISIEFPWPQPGIIAFLQVGRMQGKLLLKSGESYRFDEIGFSGYTSHRLHPIFGRINDADPANITIIAASERTGQEKTVKISSDGWYWLDANYSDYLADGSAPWVADGDKLRLLARDANGQERNGTIQINLTEDRQEADL